MSGIGLHVLAQQQRVQAERVGLELVRAIGTAVDAELRSTISVLESLATTFTLDGNDLSAFRERARRVLDTQPQWAGVTLTDPSGARLVDTRLGAGSQIPPISDRRASIASSAPVRPRWAISSRARTAFCSFPCVFPSSATERSATC